jgi:hypothetical protein
MFSTDSSTNSSESPPPYLFSSEETIISGDLSDDIPLLFIHQNELPLPEDDDDAFSDILSLPEIDIHDELLSDAEEDAEADREVAELLQEVTLLFTPIQKPSDGVEELISIQQSQYLETNHRACDSSKVDISTH